MENNKLSTTRVFPSPSGRPRNSRNKVSAPIKQLLADFTEDNFKQFKEDFSKLQTRDRAKMYLEILPYIVPRMKDVALTIDSIPGDQIENIIKKLMSPDYDGSDSFTRF